MMRVLTSTSQVLTPPPLSSSHTAPLVFEPIIDTPTIHPGTQTPPRFPNPILGTRKPGTGTLIPPTNCRWNNTAVQAAYTADFLTAMFAHPSVTGVLLWGFWAARHWKPNAAMFRHDWTRKPNGDAFYDLVYKQWWTDTAVSTDAYGRIALRGFKGKKKLKK